MSKRPLFASDTSLFFGSELPAKRQRVADATGLGRLPTPSPDESKIDAGAGSGAAGVQQQQETKVPTIKEVTVLESKNYADSKAFGAAVKDTFQSKLWAKVELEFEPGLKDGMYITSETIADNNDFDNLNGDLDIPAGTVKLVLVAVFRSPLSPVWEEWGIFFAGEPRDGKYSFYRLKYEEGTEIDEGGNLTKRQAVHLAKWIAGKAGESNKVSVRFTYV